MSKEYTAAQKIFQRYLNSIRDNELGMKILAEIELHRGRLSLNGVASGEKVKATISGDSLE